MKQYIAIKTGYMTKGENWECDIYKVIIIPSENFATMDFNIKTGYEGIFPIKTMLNVRGYKELSINSAIYGKIKKSQYKGYVFETEKDIQKYISNPIYIGK